jgi:hypothetical protein
MGQWAFLLFGLKKEKFRKLHVLCKFALNLIKRTFHSSQCFSIVARGSSTVVRYS